MIEMIEYCCAFCSSFGEIDGFREQFDWREVLLVLLHLHKPPFRYEFYL
jgi:hypothetical protein